MDPVLAVNVFSDPGHIIIIAIPIVGIVIFLLTRHSKDSSNKPDVLDPPTHNRDHHSSHGYHGPGHKRGHH